jgi:hypothetical protein
MSDERLLLSGASRLGKTRTAYAVVEYKMAAWAKSRSLDLAKPEDVAKIVKNWAALVYGTRRTNA